MQKDYSKWFKLKPALNNQSNKNPFYKEREVWYASLGVNVGFEIDGKNNLNYPDEYLRAVIIIKITGRDTFIALPLSSKTEKYQNKTYAYITEIKGRKSAILFNQIRAIDAKRLKYRIEQMSETEFENIKSKLRNYL